jgi:hypothetical protein
VWSVELHPTFRRNVSPPSSGSKNSSVTRRTTRRHIPEDDTLHIAFCFEKEPIRRESGGLVPRLSTPQFCFEKERVRRGEWGGWSLVWEPHSSVLKRNRLGGRVGGWSLVWALHSSVLKRNGWRGDRVRSAQTRHQSPPRYFSKQNAIYTQ